MSWQKVLKGKRKKERPNSLRLKPTIAFRSDLSPGALGYLVKLAIQKEKSKFINQAIEMRYYFSISKARFISELIKENFQLTKHLLRKEGRKRKL